MNHPIQDLLHDSTVERLSALADAAGQSFTVYCAEVLREAAQGGVFTALQARDFACRCGGYPSDHMQQHSADCPARLSDRTFAGNGKKHYFDPDRPLQAAACGRMAENVSPACRVHAPADATCGICLRALGVTANGR